MRLFKHSLLSLAALNGSTDAFLSGDINTSMLLSWQILNNGNDLTTNQSINPLMMAQLFGDNSDGKFLLSGPLSSPIYSDIKTIHFEPLGTPTFEFRDRSLTSLLTVHFHLLRSLTLGFTLLKFLIKFPMMMTYRKCF